MSRIFYPKHIKQRITQFFRKKESFSPGTAINLSKEDFDILELENTLGERMPNQRAILKDHGVMLTEEGKYWLDMRAQGLIESNKEILLAIVGVIAFTEVIFIISKVF